MADLNVAVNNHAGANAGTSTATLSFAGGAPPPNVATNEEWNGTSWTEDADLNTARERLQGCGTSTAALCIDGATTPGPGAYPATESWNGTAWTEVNDTSTVHYWGAAWGSQTSAVVVGSYPAATHSDEWDGTSWAEAAVMPTSLILYNAGTGGPGASEGIVMGGSANSVVTQEWTLTASVETVAFD